MIKYDLLYHSYKFETSLAFLEDFIIMNMKGLKSEV